MNPDTANNFQADTGQTFDALRLKWHEMLTGGTGYRLDENNVPVDPYIRNRIKGSNGIEQAAREVWESMHKDPDGPFLWSGLDITTDARDLWDNFNRLKIMALAYATRGSSLYEDARLGTDIIAGLDWMIAHRYNPTALPHGTNPYGNWWFWEIGGPLALNDTVVLLYDKLKTLPDGNAKIKSYTAAVNHFMPDPSKIIFGRHTATGANLVWVSTVAAVRAILVKDAAKLAVVRDGLDPLFAYVESGDGFYRDGSFIQHEKHPYTGGYGNSLLQETAKLLYLLSASPWEVTHPDKDNLFEWIHNAFEPLLYKGAMMDMVRGREISRAKSQDHIIGHGIINGLLQVCQFAPADKATRIKSLVKYMLQEDTFRDYFAFAPVYLLGLARQIKEDASIEPRGELVTSKLYPNMDRAVHLRAGWAFGISMFSSRIFNYESINGENGRSWHTADGMVYLYNNDLGHYSEDYWATVDYKRLPGTTVETTEPAYGANSNGLSSKDWVGGSELNGYAVAGMELAPPGSELSARKSWFMLDNEVVMLGSAINGGATPVETIIENRRLNEAGNYELTVNDKLEAFDTGWQKTLPNTSWVHLAGIAGDIGYYFPGGAAIHGKREQRTSSWRAVNITGSTDPITRQYLTLWFDHGANAANATYAYVLLPGKTAAQVAEYARQPGIKVLENSPYIQAVQETALGLTGVNFWENERKTLEVAGKPFITSSSKASVIIRQHEAEIELAVSDPTQANSDSIELELHLSNLKLLASDPAVTVEQLEPALKLKIQVAGAKGQSFTARLGF